MRQKVIQNWGNFMGKCLPCVRLEVSTEKPENCQLSDSFKEDVCCLIKTNCHLKHPQRLKDIDSLLRVRVKPFIWELTAANQRVSNSVFSVSSYILVLR